MGNPLLLMRLLTAINTIVDHDALDLLQAELSLDIQKYAPSIYSKRKLEFAARIITEMMRNKTRTRFEALNATH